MSKRKLIIGQDKDINGPLSKTIVSNVISKFLNYYNSHQDDNIGGFELNGAKQVWDAFAEGCREKGMDAEYNSNSDLSLIHNGLKSIVRSILKSKNK